MSLENIALKWIVYMQRSRSSTYSQLRLSAGEKHQICWWKQMQFRRCKWSIFSRSRKFWKTSTKPWWWVRLHRNNTFVLNPIPKKTQKSKSLNRYISKALEMETGILFSDL